MRFYQELGSLPIITDWGADTAGFRNTPIGTVANIAGLPAITVPNGFGDKHLPTGLQLTGRAFDENRLIAVANRYQQTADWHRKHPDV